MIPTSTANCVLAPVKLLVCKSPTALAASDRPIIATVGPMTTGGMIRFTQSTPIRSINSAITTYTSPANAAPIMSPTYPAATVVAPANAADIEPINAKEEPKNTGLFLRVNAT